MLRPFERLPTAGWWWVFALLIAAPAATLAMLGVSAWRADDIERRQVVQEQKDRTARLIALALSDFSSSVLAEARLASANRDQGAAGDVVYFEVDRDLTLFFPLHRVHVSASPSVQPMGMSTAPAESLTLAERAREAHAQGLVAEALALYGALSGTGELAEWARTQVAVLGAASGGGPPYVAPLAMADSEARTPSGVPLALALCAQAEVAGTAELRRLQPLLERTHVNLRAGLWWMSLEDREMYEAALVHWMRRSGSKAAVDADATAVGLALVASAVTGALDGTREALPRAEIVPGENAMLLLWARPRRGDPRWSGVAVPREVYGPGFERMLAPLVAGQPFSVTMWQGAAPVWRSASHEHIEGRAQVALDSFPGWSLSLDEREAAAPLGATALRVGRVVVPVVVLGCGLLMTAWIIRREVALREIQARFLAAVTHEFKSPLTSLNVLTERLVRHTDGQVVEYARAMHAEAQRLDGLVDRMLEAQQLREGRRAYQFAPTDLGTLIDDVLRAMRPQAEARQSTVAAAPLPLLPPLHVDPHAVRDALRNLVDNALKYSPPGSHVEIAVTRGAQHVDIDVVDQGVGVNPEEAERIFAEFYRSARGDHANVRGTGLGLALVKATADAHGGSVTVDSDGVRGSRFTLTLPVPGLPSRAGAPLPSSPGPRSAHSG